MKYSHSAVVLLLLISILCTAAGASEVVDLSNKSAVVRCWIQGNESIRIRRPSGETARNAIIRRRRGASTPGAYRLGLSYIEQIMFGSNEARIRADFNEARALGGTTIAGANLTAIEVLSGSIFAIAHKRGDAHTVASAMKLPWDGASGEMFTQGVDRICAVQPRFFEQILTACKIQSFNDLLRAKKEREYFAWFAEDLTLEDVREIQIRESGKRLPLTPKIDKLLKDALKWRK